MEVCSCLPNLAYLCGLSGYQIYTVATNIMQILCSTISIPSTKATEANDTLELPVVEKVVEGPSVQHIFHNQITQIANRVIRYFQAVKEGMTLHTWLLSLRKGRYQCQGRSCKFHIP